MEITQLTFAQAEALTPLLKEKGELEVQVRTGQERITQIDAELMRIVSPTSTPEAPKTKKFVMPKEPASSRKRTTGKKNTPKIEPSAVTSNVTPNSPTPPAGAPTGELRERVMGLLRESNGAGLSVKEMAARLNVKDTNVYNWFNTTGKKIEEIEKTGPAKYRLRVQG